MSPSESLTLVQRVLVDDSSIIQRQPQRINDDILIRIFLHVMIEDWSRVRKAKKCAYLVRCTHVCRYWRTIALNSPVLWQFIPIWLTYTARREESWFAELSARYERSRESKELFILIRKAPDACFSLGFGNIFSTIIQPNLHRYREIVILHDDETIYRLLEYGSALEVLKVLSVHVVRGKLPMAEGSTQFRLTRDHSPPLLEDFSIYSRSSRFKVDPSFFGSKLKKLCLRDDYATLSEAHQILSGIASTIEDLRVGISLPSQHPPPSLDPLYFPKLNSLSVTSFPTFLDEGVPRFSSFEVFGNTSDAPLRLPSLRNCVVSTTAEFPPQIQRDLITQAIIKFIKSLPTSLPLLQLTSIPPGGSPYIWSHLLSELSSTNNGNDSRPTFILPKLLSVAFHGCPGLLDADVRHLIASREKGHSMDPPALRHAKDTHRFLVAGGGHACGALPKALRRCLSPHQNYWPGHKKGGGVRLLRRCLKPNSIRCRRNRLSYSPRSSTMTFSLKFCTISCSMICIWLDMENNSYFSYTVLTQQRHKEDHTQKMLQMRLARAGPSADLFILMRYTPSTDNIQNRVHDVLKAVSPTLESLSLAVTYAKDQEGALPPITFPVLSYIAICGTERYGTPPRLCSSFEVFGTVEGDASLQFPSLSSSSRVDPYITIPDLVDEGPFSNIWRTGAVEEQCSLVNYTECTFTNVMGSLMRRSDDSWRAGYQALKRPHPYVGA
ncbi:6805_t:CDS:2 [Acaulospora colombiana]|uniref:6805_t:CDS:1 n=1 Tax=Acaulospora colombiana TaxID=27376 RepID=A0ACA9M1S5_9GLOM|nr:6805_t:CDS:2 [Acaulospora colombiana]